MQTISGERRQGRASHTRGFTGEADDGRGERVSIEERRKRCITCAATAFALLNEGKGASWWKYPSRGKARCWDNSNENAN